MRQSDSIGEMPKVDVVERVARAICVERVARAICRAMWGDDCPLMTAAAFEEEHWSQTLAEARAAIAAMREPTEAMLGAGQRPPRAPFRYVAEESLLLRWQAMIDAALATTSANGS